jgi:hypothetical protein
MGVGERLNNNRVAFQGGAYIFSCLDFPSPALPPHYDY